MISKDEILMGRDKTHLLEYTQDVSNNIDKLLIALNKFRAAYGKPMTVSSGWRDSASNKAAGGAPNSNHLYGMACDFKDPDGAIDAFAMECDKNGKLKEWGLWLEHPDNTKGWCHLDIKDRGNRKSNVFKP